MTAQDLALMFFAARDEKYADFTAKLIPTLPRESFIGVRAPEIKRIAGLSRGDSGAEEFMDSLPHLYHEENCLHAALINGIKDFEKCLARTEAFIPFIDNWAVNDSLNPKVFKKHRDELKPVMLKWIKSGETYTRRFGLRMVMANYLDGDFDEDLLALAADLRSDEYYVNMMTAWLFAEALAKQWDKAIGFIESKRLESWTHNKAIQKARESYRISPEKKEYLKSLKAR